MKSRRCIIMLSVCLIVSVLLFQLQTEEMAMAEEKSIAEGIIVHPPTEEEDHAYFLELAGEDPRRQAAIKHWWSREGIDLFDLNEERIAELHFEDVAVEKADLEHLLLFPETDLLSLERVTLSDDALGVLGKLKQLWWVHAKDAPSLDNRVCSQLAKIPKLERLSLSNSQVDDEGVAELSKIKSLKVISLDGTKVTPASAKLLAKLEELIHLSLADTAIDDSAMKHIAKLRKLRWLDLSNTLISDAGVEDVNALDLRVIMLGNTKVTDRAVHTIAKMQHMTKANLQGTQITNEAVRLLAPLPKLGDELNLSNTAIDDGCVPYFAEIQCRPRIDLRGTKISEEGMKRIRALLNPKAALYNDLGVPEIDRERVKAERETQ